MRDLRFGGQFGLVAVLAAVLSLASSAAGTAQFVECRATQDGAGASYEGQCSSPSFNGSIELEAPAAPSKRGQTSLGVGVWKGSLSLGGGDRPVELRIGEGESHEGSRFRSPFAWHPVEAGDLELVEGRLTFRFHAQREVPASDLDKKILERALELLASEQVWDRNDDRVCETSDTTFSLYCALHRSMVETTGAFDHRQPALQAVRRAVEHLSIGEDYDHRLRDFNNSKTLREVRRALSLAKFRVDQQVEGRPWLQFRQYTTLGIEQERSANVHVGDVDGDGDLDAIVANGRHWPGQNRLYLNNGQGGMGLSRWLSQEQDTSYAAPLGDFDGDGDLDLAVGNDNVRNLLLINDGEGRFTPGPVLGGIESTRGVALGDVDGDGHLDVLLTNRGDPNAIFFGHEQVASQGFARESSFGSQTDSTIAIALGDLDGDGDLDLALANRDGQPNFTALNDGQGSFSQGLGFGTGSDETRDVELADFDGDGLLDVALANIRQPDRIYFGDGAGGFSTDGAAVGGERTASYTLASADLDRDGDLDLVVGRAGQTNAFYLNRGDGRGFEEVSFGAADAATYGVAVGDLNGDGFPEILTANSDAQNAVFANAALANRRLR